MIKVILKTSTRREVIADEKKNILEFLEENEVGDGCQLILDGTILTQAEIHGSFENLGIKDGDSVRLSAIVKAFGA